MIKTLMGSIRDYKTVTIATPLLVLGEVLCEMMVPFITADMIDAIKDGATVAQMLPTAGFLVLIALTSLAFGAAAGVTCSHASCGFAKNLRHDLFYKIQTFSFANIDEFSSSSLVTRLTTDINNVQQAFMMLIRIAVRAPLVLVFAFAMAYAMGGSVAMVYLVIIPLLGFGLFFIIFKVRPIFSRVFHKYDALNESVEENVTGMRVVKSYVREDFEKEKFATAAHDVQMDFTRAEKLLAFNNPMMNICVNGAFVIIIYLGSKLIITSQGTLFDVGQLSSIFTYGFAILMSLMQLSMIFVMVTMADESAHRITEVLAAEPTIADPAEPVLEVADGSIDFDHVSFKYSAHAKRQALDDIDLHIKSGETIGIIGGTGSAKSTLVNLIAVCTTPPKAPCAWAAWTYATTTWTRCATKWPWCCRKTCCLAAPLPRTCAGATRTPPTRKSARRHIWPAPTSLSMASPRAMTPGSNRAAPMFPAVRSSACALRVPCCVAPRS